jgi:hypothetical protein
MELLMYHIVQHTWNCGFLECLYGPKSHWSKPKQKEKEKEPLEGLLELCRYGVEANYMA